MNQTKGHPKGLYLLFVTIKNFDTNHEKTIVHLIGLPAAVRNGQG